MYGKSRFIVIVFVAISIFFSCSDVQTVSTDKQTLKLIAQKPPLNEKRIILLQPFGDMDTSKVEFVNEMVRKFYNETKILVSIPLPKEAYYKPRKRYRADSLIDFLNRKSHHNEIIIGLTNKDISCTDGKIKDWGIMGLGFCPGNACVASTFRLSKTETNLQLFKVAIHELGHTQGLPHCTEKTCFMRDAEGKNHTNEEKEFCSSCKNKLKQKGWLFN